MALAALGFALGLVRDASVATLLAEKMSAPEKVVMTLITFVGLTVGGYLVEQHQAVAPAHAGDRAAGLRAVGRGQAAVNPRLT